MNRAAPGGNSHEVRSESFLPCAARYLSCGNSMRGQCVTNCGGKQTSFGPLDRECSGTPPFSSAPGGNSHEVRSESFLPCAARYLSRGNSIGRQCVTNCDGKQTSFGPLDRWCGRNRLCFSRRGRPSGGPDAHYSEDSRQGGAQHRPYRGISSGTGIFSNEFFFNLL